MKIRNTKKNLAKLEFLRILKKLKPSERKIIISVLDSDAIDTLCETVTNVFFNDLRIGKKRKKELYENFEDKQKLIGKLSNKNIDFKRRKKLLVQEGGSLALIL